MTWSSTDTPELNASSERKCRSLGEMCLAKLTDSGSPKSFWWDAYCAACHITRMMPTRTCRGWMSPIECVPGGRTPNLPWLRRWGCKAYVLIPKADRRKDWEDKAMVCYFIGYSKTKAGYRILLCNTVVTSVHVYICTKVLFDECIPELSADSFRELDKATVKSHLEERQVGDFDWLVGQYHMDEGLLYKTTRVIVRRDLIVGFRSLITAGKVQVEDKTPIHIADLQSMTEEFSRRLRKKSGAHDDGTSGGDSTVTAGVTPPTVEPEKPSEMNVPPSGVPESGGKRVRTKRVLTNVSSLGKIHAVDVDIPLLHAADSIFMTDCVSYREPETYQESLDCPEWKEWRRTRKLERDALNSRGVMRVVRTPMGVRPIKSRYVYKRKHNKDGSVKKYKARLVALGFGQVPGVDVFNTFAPVVKSISVRLLIALTFIYNMHVHQLDVSNAFCYADIDGDVYMEPTPDFALPPSHCFQLLKSLYGLRSSPRSWWKHLDKFIRSLLCTLRA